jgi:hypothetical protein
MANNGHEGALTLAAGVNLLPTLLAGAGYTGPYAFQFVTITNLTGADIFIARRSDVSDAGATKGKKLEDGASTTLPASGGQKIDVNKLYIYSAAGGEISISCNR